MVFWATSSYSYSWFIQYWSEKYENPGDVILFEKCCAILVMSSLSLGGLKSVIILSGCVQITRKINLSMLGSLSHASLSEFFDLVPIGRILNRFLKDTEIVDLQMAYMMDRLVLVM
jgi:hypothetical protein